MAKKITTDTNTDTNTAIDDAAARRLAAIAEVGAVAVKADVDGAACAVAGARVMLECYKGDTIWCHTRASDLEGEGRALYAALMKVLKEGNHSKPAMVWKRIREQALLLAPAKGADGTPSVTEVESESDKVRRLCEKDIQSMYSRIKRAQDVDRDVLSLIPVLLGAAKQIGFQLKEPE